MAIIKNETKLIEVQSNKNDVWLNLAVEIKGEILPLQVGLTLNNVRPIKINTQYDDENKVRQKQLANKVIEAIMSKSEELEAGETYISNLNFKVQLYKTMPPAQPEEVIEDIRF